MTCSREASGCFKNLDARLRTKLPVLSVMSGHVPRVFFFPSPSSCNSKDWQCEKHELFFILGAACIRRECMQFPELGTCGYFNVLYNEKKLKSLLFAFLSREFVLRVCFFNTPDTEVDNIYSENGLEVAF